MQNDNVSSPSYPPSRRTSFKLKTILKKDTARSTFEVEELH